MPVLKDNDFIPYEFLRERVEPMKALWAREGASRHGEVVNVDPTWSWPEPAHKHAPQILTDSYGARGMQRAIRSRDGWLQNTYRGLDLSERIAESGGRDPEPISITAFVAPRDRKVPDQQKAACAECAGFSLLAAGADTVPPIFRQYATYLTRALDTIQEVKRNG